MGFQLRRYVRSTLAMDKNYGVVVISMHGPIDRPGPAFTILRIGPWASRLAETGSTVELHYDTSREPDKGASLPGDC